MQASPPRGALRRLLVIPIAGVLLLTAQHAGAQNGRISGTVSDAGGQPIAAAQVIVPMLGLAAQTAPNGSFVIRGVPPGTYALRVYRLGFKPVDFPPVFVSRATEATVFVRMEAAAVQLSGTVVSAARRVQKITDAPATVTRLDEPAIENTVGNSFAPALKRVNGIEFIQVGVSNVQLNARGFNSSFNNRMLMMEDGRIATFAESGLPIALHTTIPKIDLASVEVLVGPGSALYGPDASNGVLTLETKDPRQYQGWAIEGAGGSRSFHDVQGRIAQAQGNWAWKISGEYQAANDWTTPVSYPAVAAGGLPIAEKNTDDHTDVARGTGTLAWYPSAGGRLQLTAGLSRLNGIGQTSVGRNQLVNYGYRNYQLQYTGDRWFAQAYMTNSLTNGTYALNAFSQNSVRFPSLTEDSLRKLSAFPAEGRLQAAEVQNNVLLGALLHSGLGAIDDAHLTWGVQLRRDRVSSFEHWLSDRLSHNPIVNDQQGGYGQLESPLTNVFRLVLSARYDRHQKVPAQFSPKAGLLYSITPDQTVRVTYNQAYKTPTVLQTDFYYPNFQPFIGVFGNADGFDVKKNDGTLVNTIAPVKPERNITWELGYKAIARDALFVDAAVYRSHFVDFLSPLVAIANPLTPTSATTFPTTAYNSRTGAKITDPAGGPQVALTYFNVGSADISGIEAGLRLYVGDNVNLWGNLNYIHVDTIRSNPTDPPEATSFNSASRRITTGVDFQFHPSLTGSITARYTNAYEFRSGVNFGRIPGFTAVDATASWAFRESPVSVTLSAQNIHVCTDGTTTPPVGGISSSSTTGKATFVAHRECGFGHQHQEMLNMPQIGTMVFLGVRIQDRRSSARRAQEGGR